jgi:NCS1 family nucleobase:cation symporter-1
MGDRNDSFGDGRLVNIELMPIAAHQRILGWRQLAPLWAVVGMSPGVYGFACAGLPPVPALLAMAVGLSVTALFGVVLSWSAGRFGIGFTPLCRGAFGPRGAMLPVLLRWLVGVSWLGVWASQLGGSILAVSATVGVTPDFMRTPLGQDAAGWGIGAVLVIAAWFVARGGMSRVGWVALASVLAVVLVSFALVVYAGIMSKGFGSWFGRSLAWTAPDLFGAVARVVALTLPGLIACSDWERFRRGRQAPQRSAFDALAPVFLVPVGVGIAFVGALLASASHAVRATAVGAPIADATAFGNLVGGLAAVALVVFMWLGAAPLVGMYSTGLAACGLSPRRVSYHVGLLLTVVGSLAVIPVVRAAADLGIEMGAVLLALAAPFGIILVDELVVRRGRVLLEELFLFSKEYGPMGGVTGSALLALVVGWLLHPEALTWLLPRLPDAARPLFDYVSRVQPEVMALAGVALVAGAIYALFAPIERGILRDRKRAPRKEKSKKKKKPAPIEDADTAGLTAPHFVANKPKEEKKEKEEKKKQKKDKKKKRMETLESDTYELSSADLESLSMVTNPGDPMADTLHERAGEKRKSTEEQRLDDDWGDPES